MISEDDDTIVLDAAPPADATAIVSAPPTPARGAERTLVLGASPRLPLVLRELEAYVAPASETLVIGEGEPAALLAPIHDDLLRMRVTARAGDVTDRALLDSLDVTSFDHVLVLSETAGRTQDMADARTTVCLLHLRSIEQRAGKKVPITSEILEIQNRDLASVAEADDFIVSNTLVSLMVSQVAENPHLVRVFDELFTARGSELYIKSATGYVRPGDVTFSTLSEAALRRNEIAVGYRLAAHARDPDHAFGVVVNPTKRTRIPITDADQLIVLAES